MTDLYDAIRGAMTPDGRVRMTLELLTAMHEEGERRSRVDDAAQSDPLTEMRDRFLTATGRMREAESRAETAERELEGAEREADAQRERRKRAEVERDAAHERAETAERERDEAREKADRARERARIATQAVIDAIGSVGPESVEQAVPRLLAVFKRMTRGRDDSEALAMQMRERAENAERELSEMRADRDSWRQQCEDARSDALRYGCERDDLTAHARACLDPEIVSRDPAHARLAALVERIEGYRS